jgi:peptidyl-dipeptidase A
VKSQRALLALAITAGLVTLAACSKSTEEAVGPAAPAQTAEEFVAEVNQTIKTMTPEITSAAWLGATYINKDSQRVESAANERWLAKNNEFIAQAKTYDRATLQGDTARAIHLLKTSSSLPAPRDPAKLKELTEITARMGAAYGAGKWCVGDDCKDIGQVSEILADTENSSYDEMKAAWEGWHTIAQPMREDYVRFVELTNATSSRPRPTASGARCSRCTSSCSATPAASSRRSTASRVRSMA